MFVHLSMLQTFSIKRLAEENYCYFILYNIIYKGKEIWYLDSCKIKSFWKVNLKISKGNVCTLFSLISTLNNLVFIQFL